MRTISVRICSFCSQHWLILIYLVILMSGFNFLAHGNQDLYPTFLTAQLKFSRGLTTVTIVVAGVGACTGGTIFCYFSDYFGRRLSMMIALIIGAILIPTFILRRDATIIIGAFLQQFCGQGAWSVIPTYLFELSPHQFRSLVVGGSYQLGNLSHQQRLVNIILFNHHPRDLLIILTTMVK
jgi:SHS family lactate transporter-like MFS transporter